MTKVARWHGDLFTVSRQKDGNVLISTNIPEKASKHSVPRWDRAEFAMWVPETEIEIVGDYFKDYDGKWI